MTPPFDPASFLAVAKELGTADTDEAKLRTAVGRAYYCAFMLARSAMGMDGDDSYNIHSKVVAAVKAKKRNIGEKLDTMLWLRKVADYEQLPRRREHRDWKRNWDDVQMYADLIVPEFEKWIVPNPS